MTRPGAHGTLYAVALTRDGTRTAASLAEAFPGIRALSPTRFAAEKDGVEGFDEPVASLLRRLWSEAGGFFLVMAAGIAVRSVAPLLTDKTEDPPVVVLDPAGRFAVPILSGHLGGANDLAREVGRRLGTVPVITTATDVAGCPAVEIWARDRGLRVENREGVVRVNAAWASGDPVAGYVDPSVGGLSLLDSLAPFLDLVTADEAAATEFRGELLAVTHREDRALERALLLRPPCLSLGVGCRKGADPNRVESAVRKALADTRLSALAVAQVATVDAKRDEPALQDLARSFGVPLQTFPAETLAGIAVPSPSHRRVREAVGTPSVAEASAMAAGGDRILLPKVKGSDWTLAVALRAPES